MHPLLSQLAPEQPPDGSHVECGSEDIGAIGMSETHISEARIEPARRSHGATYPKIDITLTDTS
jgi:hypothetical protein